MTDDVTQALEKIREIARNADETTWNHVRNLLAHVLKILGDTNLPIAETNSFCAYHPRGFLFLIEKGERDQFLREAEAIAEALNETAGEQETSRWLQ